MSLHVTCWVTVTKVAMITTKAGMRTLSGMKFFNSEMSTLLRIKTKVVAAPMPMPLTRGGSHPPGWGHMPSTKRKVGFSSSRPFLSTLSTLFTLPHAPHHDAHKVERGVVDRRGDRL